MVADHALAAFARLGPGARVGRYTIVRSGGCGGMAAVWMAREDATDELVALKTMLPAFSMRPEHEKMFLAEGRIASRIHHPNVCRVREVGEDSGVRYIVMDWIRGGSLAALMGAHGGALPPGVAARIVADVARGLDAVHAAKGDDGATLGIVHRDVSPQNVLVSDDGRATIADFGVAKITGGDGGGTASGFVKGKVRYMAPEQAYAEPVDARTDVFALGIVLCEAMTGRHPFAEETDIATLAKIASGEPVTIPECEGCPEALRAIVARAVEQERAARFPTMGAFADALEAFDEAYDDAREEVARLVRETLPARDDGGDASATPVAHVVGTRSPETRANRTRMRQVVLGLVLTGLVAFAASRGLGGLGAVASAGSAPVASFASLTPTATTPDALPSSMPSPLTPSTPSTPSPAETAISLSSGSSAASPSAIAMATPARVALSPTRPRETMAATAVGAPPAPRLSPVAALAPASSLGGVGAAAPASSSSARPRDVLRTRE